MKIRTSQLMEAIIPKSKFPPRLRNILGVVQLAVALCGIVYLLYPSGPHKTESTNVSKLLEQVRKNNPDEKVQRASPTPLGTLNHDSSARTITPARVQPVFYVPSLFGVTQQLNEMQSQVKVQIITLTNERVDEGTPLSFEARIISKLKCGEPKYQWTTVEKIISGTDTKSIIVDTTGTGISRGFMLAVVVTSDRCWGHAATEIPVAPLRKTMHGKVTNVRPGEKEKVEVEIKGAAYGPYSMPLSIRGGFSFSNLPNGQYFLTVKFPDGRNVRRKFSIKPGDARITLPSIAWPSLNPISKHSTKRVQPDPIASPTSELPTQHQGEEKTFYKDDLSQGSIAVKWPERLAKGWKEKIVVTYAPPEGSQSQNRRADEMVPWAAFKVVCSNGIKDLSESEPDFKPLINVKQTWFLNIEPDGTGAPEAKCKVTAKIKRKTIDGHLEKLYGRPDVDVAEATIIVDSATLSAVQTRRGIAFFIMTGAFTLAYSKFEKAMSFLHVGFESTVVKEVTPTSTDTVPVGREVNAWLSDCELPLVVGQNHTLGVDIGTPRSYRVGGSSFTEPNWEDRDQLDLLILVDGPEFEVTPSFQQAILPRTGNMETRFFGITPKSEGPLKLNISIFLAHELTLLEEFAVELTATNELAEVMQVAR
jgi:hypothetical protein